MHDRSVTLAVRPRISVVSTSPRCPAGSSRFSGSSSASLVAVEAVIPLQFSDLGKRNFGIAAKILRQRARARERARDLQEQIQILYVKGGAIILHSLRIFRPYPRLLRRLRYLILNIVRMIERRLESAR